MRVHGDVSGEISRRDRGNLGDVPHGSGEISFLILSSLWCSERVDLSWNLHGLLRGRLGGEFILFEMTERALIVLIGREALADV